MTFTTLQIQFLQRLVSERPTQRRVGEVSRHFSEHFSIGTTVGRLVEYRDDHLRMAAELLRTHDLPVSPIAPGSSRAEAAVFGGMSEKAFSAAPHSGSIGVKCVGSCTLDGVELYTPVGTYLVVTPEVAGRITCDRFMLVENLETFRQLERYGWVDYRGLSVLVIYRGDTALSTGEALEVLRAKTAPIWAFPDFDPAGLVIANALPPDRLERIILPNEAWLRKAANTSRGRQLFDEQEAGARASLERSTHHEVRRAWAVLAELRSAVTQERMLSYRDAKADGPLLFQQANNTT